MKITRGLFSVDQLVIDDVNEICDRAAFYKKRFQKRHDKKVGGLNGRTLINIFLEPSTRTRISFESAAKRMGMLVSNMIADASAMTKGESRVDTIKTLDAMNFDVFIMRTSENELPYQLSAHTDAAIINAGDGTNEHPTQALLDYFTIRELNARSKINEISIVGNIVHSRVARSNVKLLLKLGFKVNLVGPEHWLPNLNDWGIAGHENLNITTHLDEVIDSSDVVMTLRVQKERFSDIHRGIMDLKEYHKEYGIKHGMLRDNQFLMHPGPVNRGIEISEDLVYCPQSIILNQVENGVAVRSAILEYVLSE